MSLAVRVFYVRVTSCTSAEVPDQLIMRYPPRSITTALEVNGARIPPSEAATLVLRRDRLDAGFAEVTYVSTEKVRTSASVSFEVRHTDEPVVSVTLERSDSSSCESNDSSRCASGAVELGWNMACNGALGSESGVFRKKRNELFTGSSPSSVEICVVCKYSGSHIALTQTVQLTARKKSLRRSTLDVIPEEDENQKRCTLKDRSTVFRAKHRRAGNTVRPEVSDNAAAGLENLFLDNGVFADGEDGDEPSWFIAGLKVGVGVSFGVCVGIGIGVGLMARTYQATTKSLRGTVKFDEVN